MGQSRRDEASSPHGHAALSPARQCMQGASPAPYVLQSFLRFHLGDSSHCQVPENLDTITRVDKGEFATPVLRHTGWENDSPNSHAGADGCRS